MQIRPETPADHPAIHTLVKAAFNRQDEADLVNALRAQAAPIVSLVAETDGAEAGHAVVGHILFTPVELTGHPDLRLFGLAPMAVTPTAQRGGIGSALVRAGLDACAAQGYGAVAVLGHPEYYPRFGFTPASRFGIDSEYDAPDNAFLMLELQPGYLQDASGTIRYHRAFGGL